MHDPRESPAQQWQRLRRAVAGERLPLAVVDLDAFEANADRLLVHVRAGNKKLRVATKSVRCVELLRRVAARAASSFGGLMTSDAAETAFLAGEGFRDLLLAYPTVQARDLALLAETNRAGARAAVVVDDPEQLGPLSRAAAAAGACVPVVIDVDLSWRPIAGAHLGVRRSPLREPAAVVALARAVSASLELELRGLLGYEAQIAGLTDSGPFSRWMNGPKRLLKRLSRPDVERRRRALVAALAAAGLEIELFNGGGTGSLRWAAAESALTEVTAGSGFLAGHLFDSYAGLRLAPALFYGLQVTRRPAPGLVTCHGGGPVASGEAGPDRLPLPALPPGLRLLPLEGAGEVQTPLRVPALVELQLGDPVFFRPAKSGELAERFGEYLLVRGDRIEARAPTYRGQGRSFLA